MSFNVVPARLTSDFLLRELVRHCYIQEKLTSDTSSYLLGIETAPVCWDTPSIVFTLHYRCSVSPNGMKTRRKIRIRVFLVFFSFPSLPLFFFQIVVSRRVGFGRLATKRSCSNINTENRGDSQTLLGFVTLVAEFTRLPRGYICTRSCLPTPWHPFTRAHVRIYTCVY